MIQVPQGAGPMFVLNSGGCAPRCRAAVYSELRWMVGRNSLQAMIQVPRGAGLMFILNSGGGVTRCRAAVFSELLQDGGGKNPFKAMIQAWRCAWAGLLFILNSGGVVGSNSFYAMTQVPQDAVQGSTLYVHNYYEKEQNRPYSFVQVSEQKSGNWIQKESTPECQCICPQSSKTVYKNTIEKNRLNSRLFPEFLFWIQAQDRSSLYFSFRQQPYHSTPTFRFHQLMLGALFITSSLRPLLSAACLFGTLVDGGEEFPIRQWFRCPTEVPGWYFFWTLVEVLRGSGMLFFLNSGGMAGKNP